MPRNILSLSLQAQVNAAMIGVALLVGGALVGALSATNSVRSAFSELADQRLPTMFQAFEAHKLIARIESEADALSRAATPTRAEAAAEATERLIADLESLTAQIDADWDSEAAALGVLSQQLPELRASVQQRLSADQAMIEAWLEAQSVHQRIIAHITSAVDDASFELAISGDEAKETLASDLDKLLTSDVQATVTLLTIRASLNDLSGQLRVLQSTTDSAVASAAGDRILSALDQISRNMGDLPDAAQADLADDMAALSAASKAATSSADAVRDALARSDRLVNAIVALVDNATFDLMLTSESMNEANQQTIEKLLEATTGDFRRSLEAAASANLAIGKLAQMVTASSSDALRLTIQDTENVRHDLAAAAVLPIFQEEAARQDLTTFASFLRADGPISRNRNMAFEASARAAALTEEMAVVMSGAISAYDALKAAQRAASDESVAGARTALVEGERLQLIIAALSLALVGSIAVFFMGPRVVRPLRQFCTAVDKLARGEPTDLPGLSRRDEIGALARSMTVIYDRAQEAQRVKIALDSSSALTLISSTDGEIIYVNAALQSFFERFASDIQAQAPGFDAQRVVGASLSEFEDAPTLVKICDIAEPVAESLTLGGRLLELAASPVLDTSGERIGVVVELRDMTAEKLVQAQIDEVVTAAADGSLDQRADLSGATGALGNIGAKVNELLESVQSSVSGASHVIHALANRDLTQKMGGDNRGAFAALRRDVNNTVESLQGMMSQISAASAAIERASGGIRTGADDMARRAESQAASLEETAATMEEMTSTISSNAQNAAIVNKTARGAADLARQGGEIVENTIASMARIEERSSEIAEIIALIDGIAFQTNLLALNAAVEAARAGEAGNGFAVVASEVRALAQRSADASGNIRELIAKSAAEVQEGVQMANQAGGAIAKILVEVDTVNTSVDLIAKSSAEQAKGIAEVATTLNQLDGLTQANSSLSAESASQASDLLEQAQSLSKVVASFKLGETEADAADAA